MGCPGGRGNRPSDSVLREGGFSRAAEGTSMLTGALEEAGCGREQPFHRHARSTPSAPHSQMRPHLPPKDNLSGEYVSSRVISYQK